MGAIKTKTPSEFRMKGFSTSCKMLQTLAPPLLLRAIMSGGTLCFGHIVYRYVTESVANLLLWTARVT